jgi:dienelactone hydrolase
MPRLLLKLVLCIAALALPATSACAAETALELGGMHVVAWEDPATEPQPVIIFSHGFHGCATQSRFLTEALAAAGYLVFAPNHRDATCDGGAASWLDRPQVPFLDVAAWNDTTYRDRADDIRHLIEALKADEHWRHRADWTRLGLVGHSLGGYTVLGLAGGWRSWKLDGVKAVLALAPYSAPFALRRTLPRLAAPVMYEGGLNDRLIDVGPRGVLASYEQSPAPKYYLAFDGADHMAWTDMRSAPHGPILAESIAFMDHYVRGMPAAPILTGPIAGIAALGYDSELGSKQVSNGNF